MLAGILIIAFSMALLIYWFRYSCILILRNEATSEPLTAEMQARFSFARVRENLQSAADLSPLHAELDRDYRVLTYLIEHAAGLELASLEDRLLLIDYRVMQRVYSVTRTLAPSKAREALVEMSTVLSILAHHLGQQAGAPSEA
jgi:hypothetical protein